MSPEIRQKNIYEQMRNSPKRISWYINRLSKMSLAEITSRLHHNLLKSTDKASLKLKQSFVGPLSSDFNPLLYALLSQPVSLKVIFLQQRNHLASISELAENYLSNTHNIFGLRHSYKDKIDWHLDPTTGNQWPLFFWGDINIRDGHRVGGPKFVWEINRLYCLPILGIAYQTTGEDKYIVKFFDLLHNWLSANPYPLGVNWTSGIELGLRLANLVWGLSFLQGYAINKQDKQNLNQFVFLHARHLYRYPAKHSSNNNHALAEAFGLFLAGVFFPHLQGATKWQVFGKEVLEREVVRQILPDGGSYEYTTTYLSFVFDFYLLYRLVCERLHFSYDPAVDERLERSCEFIYNLMDQNGNIPNIGDQDSAILVNFGLDNHENFRSILNTGSILFNRPEFQQANFPDFKTCMLLGDKMTSPDIDITPSVGRTEIFMPDSGLAVIRSNTDGKEIIFTGNATPLGMPPLYAHGHLDALSFTLSVDGREIFVDPGTYLYHSGGKWRRYFRSTAAHNTIRINGSDLTEQVADFMFGKPYHITEHTLGHNSEGIVWRAAHDAYERIDQPIQLNRTVTFVPAEKTFFFVDSVLSSSFFSVEQFFHLHPDCSITLNDKIVSIGLDGQLIVRMKFDNQVDLMCNKGNKEQMSGWFSPRFNEVQKSCTIVAKVHCSGDLRLRTEISIL